MFKFYLFIKKIHFLLLFILLESLAVHYYANSTSYTKAKLLTASNYVVGGIYSQLAGWGSYFHLRRENRALVQEVAELHNQIDALLTSLSAADSDALTPSDSSVIFNRGMRRYDYFTARVINNSITRQENYITLNRGTGDGLMPRMALISEGGIVGYVLGCSDHFAVCMSVLNRNFKTGGKIKGTDYFGSLSWDGRNDGYVTLSEVEKYAPIQVGDTIVTTNSTIFPPDVLIGTVEDYSLYNGTYYQVKVKLHSNIAALRYLLVVKYRDADEQNALEEKFESL